MTPFLSSTFIDLVPERKAVLEVLRKKRMLPLAMEDFVASARTPADTALEHLRKSDLIRRFCKPIMARTSLRITWSRSPPTSRCGPCFRSLRQIAIKATPFVGQFFSQARPQAHKAQNTSPIFP